jgi:Protein of unknown function (DUF1559)
VGLAMHNYHDNNGRLPPAVVYGEDGKALYSWRVLLLPYIEQKELYDEFRLDEPWDSPHNIRLLPRMPLTYAAPGSKARKLPSYHTVVHVFVGKGTAFEEGQRLRMGIDFPDGTANTIMLIEAGTPVPWTKPDELIYAADQPLPDLRPLFKNGIRAAFIMDGSVQFIPIKVKEQSLRLAIVRNSGKRYNLWED